MLKVIGQFLFILGVIELLEVQGADTSFRDALKCDLPVLNTLMRVSKEAAGGSNYTQEYLDKFMEKLSVTPEVLAISKIKILYVGQEVAGFYSFYINDDTKLELDNFFLAPVFLYKGYGKILWDHCLNTAKEYQGRAYFVLWSSLEAIHFYQKRGCIQIGERPSPADLTRIQPLFQYNFQKE